jgi:hypothetical protein
LSDIERGVENVTAMGKQINEHLKEDVSAKKWLGPSRLVCFLDGR